MVIQENLAPETLEPSRRVQRFFPDHTLARKLLWTQKYALAVEQLLTWLPTTTNWR
jgi:hypothetical protein